MAKLTHTVTKEVTWKEIKDAVEQGKADMFPVGTEVETELKNGHRAIFVVAAVNLYHPEELIFMSKDCIEKERHMNSNWSTEGGWPACEMRTYLNEELVKLLPDDLLSVITPKQTLQVIGNKKVSSEDILFLPSEYEVFGAKIFAAYNGEDKQFPYYCDRRNRISLDFTRYVTAKWLSSPFAGNPLYFCAVGAGNAINPNSASNLLGVAPGFVIRKS